MTTTYVQSVALTASICPTCGVLHAVPDDLLRKMSADFDNGRRQRGIYCPNGHNWIYTGKGQAQIERERAEAERKTRERLERQLANRDEDLRSERASHRTTKGHLTRAKRRTVNGVCPCCDRSFPQLADHIRTEHPDYVETT